MPPRKSDTAAPRKSDASASTARFAPIEDDPLAQPAHAPAPAPSMQHQQHQQQHLQHQQPLLPNTPAAQAHAQAPVHAPTLAQVPAPTPSPAHGQGPPPSPALALPTMDTSMPPPSLPPPGGSGSGTAAQTPEAPQQQQQHRPGSGSGSASVLPLGGGSSGSGGGGIGGPSQRTPSEKGKEREEGKSGPGGHPKEAITIPIEELQLPKSIITRLAKGVLPSNTQIQANAILAMTKSATVFINHLANAANEVTALQSKKTIMPADVFRALDEIEYGFMRERVEAEFSKFNETQTTKRSAYRKKVAAAKKQPKDAGDGDTTMGGTDGDVDGDADGDADGDITMGSVAGSASGGQHRAKKARTSGADADATAELEDASDPPSDAHYESADEGSMPGDEEEEEDEEDEDDEGAEGEQNGGEEQDELEEREDRPDEDEALDDGNNSD